MEGAATGGDPVGQSLDGLIEFEGFPGQRGWGRSMPGSGGWGGLGIGLVTGIEKVKLQELELSGIRRVGARGLQGHLEPTRL